MRVKGRRGSKLACAVEPDVVCAAVVVVAVVTVKEVASLGEKRCCIIIKPNNIININIIKLIQCKNQLISLS